MIRLHKNNKRGTSRLFLRRLKRPSSLCAPLLVMDPLPSIGPLNSAGRPSRRILFGGEFVGMAGETPLLIGQG